MTSEHSDPLSTRNRFIRAFASYDDDTVHLVDGDLAGMTHLVATRKGIFAVHEGSWKLVAYGYFFGLSMHGGDIYAFESCDMPHGPLPRGRITRFAREGSTITATEVMAKGLGNGCHGIDFIGGRLHVVDTYGQVVLRFAPDCRSYETLRPLPVSPTGRWQKNDTAHAHVNAILAVGEKLLLLLHNTSEHTARQSEVALYNREWQPLGRWTLPGKSCHGLALLEDGTLLSCDSMSGDLISANGLRIKVSPYLTRGLAVGPDSIVIGGSALANREERISSSGTITFFDRDYNLRTVIDLPGAPTEIRRLDEQDSGLSSYLEQVPWGRFLKEGTPSQPKEPHNTK